MATRPYTRRERRRGATLIEVAIAVSLLVLVVSSLAGLSTSGSRLFQASVVNTEADAVSRRALQVIADELLRTGAGVMNPPALTTDSGSSTIDYQHAVGNAGSAVLWGEPMRIQLEYDPAEADDGVDNDGDGLVDEGQVVLIHDAGAIGEQRRVLCRGVTELLAGEVDDNDDDNGNGLVDEAGLSFHLVGDVMEVRLTLQRVDENGRIVERSLETSVRLRN